MDCPRCKYITKVLETNYNKTGNVVRRRECSHCGFRITTLEHLKTEDLKSPLKDPKDVKS